MNKKLFASIPKEDIASGEFSIKAYQLADHQRVGIVNEDVIQVNVANDESHFIWNDYFDQEAIKKIGENKKEAVNA